MKPLSTVELEEVGSGGGKPGLAEKTPETVEAKAEASARSTEETVKIPQEAGKEQQQQVMEEAPLDVGQEKEQPEPQLQEPQEQQRLQQGQLGELVAERSRQRRGERRSSRSCKWRRR